MKGMPRYFDYPMTNKNSKYKCPNCGLVFKRHIYVYRDLWINDDYSRSNVYVAYCFSCRDWITFH